MLCSTLDLSDDMRVELLGLHDAPSFRASDTCSLMSLTFLGDDGKQEPKGPITTVMIAADEMYDNVIVTSE